MNWDMESNYICPTVNNNYVHLTDCVLPENSTTTLIQNPSTSKLSTEKMFDQQFLFILVSDNDGDIQHDGMGHAAQTQAINTIATNKQNFANFASTDLNGKCERENCKWILIEF